MAYMRTRGGLGEYDKMPTSYRWMFYPPPYAFADPQNITPPPGFHAPPEEMFMTAPKGLSGCGCGGGCGGCGGGHKHGMGDASGSVDPMAALSVLLSAIALYYVTKKKKGRSR